jgi:hypothetical protein
MRDSTLLDRLNRLADAELASRESNLAQAINAVNSQFAAKGAFNSGRRLTFVHQVIENELDIRNELVWNATRRVLSERQQVTDEEMRRELKNYMKDRLFRSQATLNHSLDQHIRDPALRKRLTIDDRAVRVQKRIEIEVDIFCDASVSRVQQSFSATPAIVIHGPVGAVQTGSGATSNISVTINESTQHSLLLAIRQAREALEASPQALPESAELVQITNDLQKELESPSKNVTRIKLLLSGLAGSIQTVASMRPAYEAIKGAGALIGLQLP